MAASWMAARKLRANLAGGDAPEVFQPAEIVLDDIVAYWIN